MQASGSAFSTPAGELHRIASVENERVTVVVEDDRMLPSRPGCSNESWQVFSLAKRSLG